MNKNWKNAALSLLLGGAVQIAAAGCSTQAPMAPSDNQQVATTTLGGRQVTTETTGTSNSVQNPQTGQDARTATEFNTRFVADDFIVPIEFTGLIVGFDVETQTIRLMEMQGSFKTWVGHVTENSELIGLQGESVQLSDFGVCSQAIVRGEIIDDDEFEINFLQMKNF